MITDRFTARVLGLVLITFALVIDTSFFVFSKPDAKSRPGFALVVVIPSLPFVAFGVYLLRKAEKMKDDGE